MLSNMCQLCRGFMDSPEAIAQRTKPRSEEGPPEGVQYMGRHPPPMMSRQPNVAFALLCDGLTSRQIADALNVREATVCSHVQHILAKLPASNRAEAVVRTYRGTTML